MGWIWAAKRPAAHILSCRAPVRRRPLARPTIRPDGAATFIRPVIDTQAGRPRRSRWPRAARAQARRNGRCLRRRPSTRSRDCRSSSAPPIRHGAQGDERETPPSSKRILIRARRSHHVDHARSPRCRHDQAATAQQAVHVERIPREPARRPRDLDLRRTRQGRHHASGVPQHRAHDRAPLRRAARPRARTSSDTPTDTGSGGYTHKFFKAPRNAEELVGAPRRHRRMGARHLRLDRPQPRLQGRVPRHARRQLRTSTSRTRRTRGAGTRKSRKRSPSSTTRSSIRRSIATSRSTRCNDVYMHVEKETDGGLIVSGAKVVATTSTPHALQLHRQQRRAADQDQGVRLRLHRADRCARA